MAVLVALLVPFLIGVAVARWRALLWVTGIWIISAAVGLPLGAFQDNTHHWNTAQVIAAFAGIVLLPVLIGLALGTWTGKRLGRGRPNRNAR